MRLVALLLMPLVAFAGDDAPALSTGRGYDERTGDALYRAICRGCHQDDGRGARGAGAYPALAADPRLASAPFVIVTVLEGRRAMPAFGRDLDDAQVAAVVRYVRTRFGDADAPPVADADVAALRRPEEKRE